MPATSTARTCRVRIKSSRRETLVRVLETAAQRADISRYEMATLMTYFLEALAEAVARGEPVTLPGFGMFQAYPWFPKPQRHWATPKCYPRFHGHYSFNAMVNDGCSPYDPALAPASVAYRVNQRHSTTVQGNKCPRSVNVPLARLRARIAADAKRKGLVLF